MRKSVVVVFVLLLVASLPALADSAADGKALFKAKCAMCHGADGKKVNASMGTRDLTSAPVQKMTDQELYTITANGKAKMPAFKAKMSDAEIKAVVVTIRDLAKK